MAQRVETNSKNSRQHRAKKDELYKKLKNRADMLMSEGVTNIKEYEFTFENIIEYVYDELWYKVTNCNIFETLMTTKDVYATIDCIIDELIV